jgi:hypothetical protein
MKVSGITHVRHFQNPSLSEESQEEPHVFWLPKDQGGADGGADREATCEMDGEADGEADCEALASTQTKQRSKSNERSMFIAAYIILLLSVTALAVAVTKYIQVSKNSNASNGASPDVASVSEQKVARPPEYRGDLEAILQTISKSSSFLEPSSPQAQALNWLVFDDQVLTEKDLSLEDPYTVYQRYSLIVLFFATNGELWEGIPWATIPDVDECDFVGIDCDRNGQVVLMDMTLRMLRGRLPDEMGSLTKLTSVTFKSNVLEGSIPSFFFQQLTELGKYGYAHNSLEKHSQRTNILSLVCDHRRLDYLSSPVLCFVYRCLVDFLDLSANGFTSTLSSEMANLSNLKFLGLDQLVGLSGTLPDSFKSLSRLQEFYLRNTQISGKFFEIATHWSDLKNLDLSQTQITGTIPTTIGLFSNMERMSFDDSKIDMTNIPSEIGLLTNLRKLSLWSNAGDGGIIPTEFGNLLALNSAHIRGSNFTGPIPSELGRLTDIENLTLEGGGLTGSVPSEIGLLTKLTELSLFGNELEGTLPAGLGNIKGLKRLGIHFNELYGSIPSGLCNDYVEIEYDCTITECDCCRNYCRLNEG